jgi:hypothetical protein
MTEATIKQSITVTSGMLVTRNERGQYYHSATKQMYAKTSVVTSRHLVNVSIQN